MNGDLAKLMELGESVDSVVRDIRLLGFLTDYAAEGGKIIVALDTAELVRYFLPMSEGEILASLNRFSAPRYKAQQVALAFIFERERLFSPGPPRPYLLLPPYEEELADHLSELKRRADFANLLAATSSAAFEHVLEDLLDVDTSGIASAIEKSKRDRLLTDEDEAKVLSLLREKYADFLYGMRFLGSDIGTELSELKSFVTDTDRLCVIADLGERIGRTVSCPRSEIASRSSSWFESIFTMRDRDPERLTSSLRDAIALEYLSHLNQQLNPEHLIVLLSHSGTLIKLSKDLRISGVAQNGYAPPAVMDLATLLFYMSNMSVAGANMTMDLDATRVVLRQLRQAGEYLMEQRSLVEKASQERSADEPRQAFLRGATSARLGDLLEAVQQREDHELALRSIPLLQKYVRRAERAAHHVRRARTRSISQFLGLLAKSETVKAKMRKEAKDLVETMSVVSQSLSSIARVGRLDLQHIDDTSIKGYSPVFSNRSMQAIYHDIVDRLAGTQNLHAVFNSLADAYEVYSDDPEMHVLMGYVLLKHNDNRSAVREMTEAHRKLPNSPDVCLLLILALRICQDWSAAWSVLDTLLHAAVPKRLRPFLLREKALLLYKTNPEAVAEAIQINEEARTAANGIKEAALVEPWLLNNEAYLRAKAYQATSDLACLRRADQALTVLLELSDEKRWIPPFFHTSCLVGRLCGTEFPNLDKTQACNRLETAIRHGELAASANDSSEEAVTDYRLARDAAKAAGCDFADW